MVRIDRIWKRENWKVNFESTNKILPNDTVYEMIIESGNGELK